MNIPLSNPAAAANPTQPGGAAPGAEGGKPAGKAFSEVLAGQNANSPTAPAAPQPHPFASPILDASMPAPVSRVSTVQQTQRAQATEGAQDARWKNSLNVGGERGGRFVIPEQAPTTETGWKGLVQESFQAEDRLDSLLEAAQKGHRFTPGELLGMQMEAFRFSQTVEVVSRATDKVVGSIKQTLSTQV